MSPPDRRVVWWPLRDRSWPRREWLGSMTWVNGHRVFARIAPDPDPIGPPVLMLHGLVVSGSYFRPIAEHLDDHYPLYIPDMPGFGRSTATRVLDLAEQADVLDAWMEIHGLRDAVVVGNSLGCQLATLLATRHPQRVAGLVMVAPTMDPATPGPVGVLWRALRDIPRERQSLWRIWVPDFLAAGPLRGLHGLMMALRDPQRERLPLVRQPLLAVAGERDPICPVPWVERYAALAHTGRCVVIPGAAHAMNYSAPDHLGRIITTAITEGEDTGTDGQQRTQSR